uniref:RXR n=1 Tax=Sinonovacula constricta TaxID=98310 RepID=A0A6B9DLB3_SINCO|nr:RXR [Sinonovacula constricta]
MSYTNSDTDSDNDHFQVPHGDSVKRKQVDDDRMRMYEVQTEVGPDQLVSISVGGNESVTTSESLSYPQAYCMICGDRGSGYHYSVLSCEGCKGFFKRTVQKNLSYSCKDSGKGLCTINKSTRNNCQFCRYQKCLQYGMKREAVREDRSPGGKHRVKKPRLNQLADMDSEVPEEQQIIDPQQSELIKLLLDTNPDKVPAYDDQTKPITEITIDEIMAYGYVELKFIIEWAKQIPNFRELIIDDQMALLKSSFMELNVFRLAQRSIPYDNAIQFATGLVLPQNIAEKLGWGYELTKIMLEFTARLKELQMDKVEFAIMNAIILTYPDAIGITEKGQVTSMQTKFLDLLRRYICMKHKHDRGRFGKLLLRLPTLRTLSAKAAERFLKLTLEGVLPLNELVKEMMC